MSVDEIKSEFRFLSKDIYELIDILNIPVKITCYNGVTISADEAFCIFLKRFAYPCRYQDMIPRFARPVLQLYMISNHIKNLLFTQ